MKRNPKLLKLFFKIKSETEATAKMNLGERVEMKIIKTKNGRIQKRATTLKGNFQAF